MRDPQELSEFTGDVQHDEDITRLLQLSGFYLFIFLREIEETLTSVFLSDHVGSKKNRLSTNVAFFALKDGINMAVT